MFSWEGEELLKYLFSLIKPLPFWLLPEIYSQSIQWTRNLISLWQLYRKKIFCVVSRPVLERRLSFVKCRCTGFVLHCSPHSAASKLWLSGRTVLITQQCFGHSWTKLAVSRVSLLCSDSPESKSRVGKALESHLFRNFPPHRASLSLIMARRKCMRYDRGCDIHRLKQLLHMLRSWFPGRI